MADWNAELYSKFEKERTLPCYDLVRAVETVPETVLDVGCAAAHQYHQVRLQRLPGK